MTAIEDPIDYDIIVRLGTDHSWSFRRKDANSNTLIPTSAKAQIRSFASSSLWQELTCVIAIDGWIHVYLTKENLDYEIWKTRKEGEWDLLITYNESQYRWVYGLATIDDGVTR